MILPQSTTVLIIGGGPVGLTTALLLSRQGISSVVLEKHTTRLGQPKAHAFNLRTMEIFRQLGMDTTSLRKQGQSLEEESEIRFCDSMAGVHYGMQQIDDGKFGTENTPEPTFNISQPRVEDSLAALISNDRNITLLKGYEWLTCSEKSDGSIISDIRIRSSGVEASIHSKYLIGCDGAHAKSREVLEIAFETLDNEPEQSIYCVSAHFFADLSHLPHGLLWFILKPVPGFGVFVAYDRAHEWVFTITYDPTITPTDTWTDTLVLQRLEESLGLEAHSLSYKIQSIVKWNSCPKIAQTYRSPRIPNAFLAGDAAHTFPPTGGLGVNTGIADAQNLAWKLKAVEQGWTTSVFLDSISAERKPVADANARQSRLNELKVRETVGQIFQDRSEMGSAEELVRDPQKKAAIQAAISANKHHTSSMNLQIGYVYGETLAAREPGDYRKENVEGARLPHAWIEVGGERRSTLDLVDGRGFVVLCGEGSFAGGEEVVVGGKVEVGVRVLGRDFVTEDREWVELMGLGKEGRGVVVRPDQHIVGSVGSMGEVEGLLMRYFGGK